MVWKRILSDDEGKALRAEMTAWVEAAKARGEKGVMRRLHQAAGITEAFAYSIIRGEANGSTESAVKIRDGLRKLQTEAPTTADAAPVEEAEDGEKPRKTMPVTVGIKLRRKAEATRASQEPLRKRVREYLQRNNIKAHTFGIRAGLNKSRIANFLTNGAALRGQNLVKLTRYLDRRTERAPISAEKTAALVQQNFPFASVAVTATATRIHRRNIQPEPKEGATAQDIARAFVDRLGIEAIEAILLIAKSQRDKES